MTDPTALRRRPLFWAALAAVLIGISLELLTSPERYADAPSLALGLGFTAAQVVAVGVIAFILDSRCTSRVALMVLALGWGGFVAGSVSSFANTAWIGSLGRAGLDSMSAALTAPLHEELTKLVGVLVILTLLHPRRVGVLQGVVIGFLVGAGFDIVENLGYAMDAGSALSAEEATGAALTSFVDRLLNGTFLHALWTATAGAGLATLIGAATPAARRRGILWAAGGLVVVLLLHAGWDLPELSPSSVVRSAVMWTLYALSLLTFIASWAIGVGQERRDSPRPGAGVGHDAHGETPVRASSRPHDS